MVSRAHSGTDTGEHNNFDFFRGHETIPKDHCKLRLSEGHVLTLGSLGLCSIKSPDTFLETKQRLVNFGSLDLSLFVVGLAILGSFGTSEIDKKKLTTGVYTLLLDFNLSDSMRS